jgi:hypothetical protein
MPGPLTRLLEGTSAPGQGTRLPTGSRQARQAQFDRYWPRSGSPRRRPHRRPPHAPARPGHPRDRHAAPRPRRRTAHHPEPGGTHPRRSWQRELNTHDQPGKLCPPVRNGVTHALLRLGSGGSQPGPTGRWVEISVDERATSCIPEGCNYTRITALSSQNHVR